MSRKLRSEVENFADLRLQDVARQAVFGNSQMHHAAGHGAASKTVTRIAEQRQIVRRGKPRRPGADDGDLFFVTRTFGFSGNRSIGLRDSGPWRSVRKRLSARMEMGESNFPRRQAGSQGWPQTRPQIEAKGFGSAGVAIRLFVAPLGDQA